METKENVALDMSQTQQSIAPGQAIPPEQTIAVEGNTTVPGLFRYRCKEYGDRVAHREKDLGIWKAYSWNDYYDHA